MSPFRQRRAGSGEWSNGRVFFSAMPGLWWRKREGSEGFVLTHWKLHGSQGSIVRPELASVGSIVWNHTDDMASEERK